MCVPSLLGSGWLQAGRPFLSLSVIEYSVLGVINLLLFIVFYLLSHICF